MAKAIVPDIRNRVTEYRLVRAGDILPNPKNWRAHPDNQRAAYRAITEDIGFAGALLTRRLDDGTLMLVDGHMRTEENPDAMLPTLITDLTEGEADLILATYDPISAMAQADAAKLEELLQGVNSDDAAVQEMLAALAEEAGIVEQEAEPVADPGAQIEKAEELLQIWKCERGQLWIIPSGSGKGEHRLLCGDSTNADDANKLMGDDKAEMVWTDPPYGVSVGDKNKFLNSIAPSNRVESNLKNDSLDEDGIAKMLQGAFDNAIAHCTAGAAWYVAAPAVPLHILFGQVLKDRGIWRQTIQWVKNNATFSPMGVCYHWQSEPIFFGWLPNGAHRYYGGRTQTTVWNIDRPLASPEHPTMKPVELVTRAIENSSLRSQIVYEPFCGSGTTLVAAEQTGRFGRGIELEEKYCAVILQRFADMGLTPQLAEAASVS